MNWRSLLDGLTALFEQGGLTLWAILFTSILLWVLILERYLFHWTRLPALRKELIADWREKRSRLHNSILMRRMHTLVEELGQESSRNLQTLQALTSILPLLGLLGTVSGMIKVFDVITLFGTGNARGMASGISEALLTTMAGLFTALSGIYFVSDLESRGEEQAREFENELVDGEK